MDVWFPWSSLALGERILSSGGALFCKLLHVKFVDYVLYMHV